MKIEKELTLEILQDLNKIREEIFKGKVSNFMLVHFKWKKRAEKIKKKEEVVSERLRKCLTGSKKKE